jgi:hypothetical protein
MLNRIIEYKNKDFFLYRKNLDKNSLKTIFSTPHISLPYAGSFFGQMGEYFLAK